MLLTCLHTPWWSLNEKIKFCQQSKQKKIKSKFTYQVVIPAFSRVSQCILIWAVNQPLAMLKFKIERAIFVRFADFPARSLKFFGTIIVKL